MYSDTIYDEVKEFKKYLWSNRWYFAIYTGIFFMIYGAWLFNINPRIDTEYSINTPFSTANWLGIGRYGLILTEYAFGLRWYNPFISTTFGYAVLWTSGILFGYLLWRAMRAFPSATAGFGLLSFVSPIMSEQLYFDLQVFHIAFAYCLCALGVGVSYWGIIKHSKSAKLFAILCMIWSFSSYQIFCVLHITAVVTCYIMLYRRWTIYNRQSIHNRIYMNLIAWHVGLFIVAMVINLAITKLLFFNDTYLSNQIQWGHVVLGEGIYNILLHCIRAFCGMQNIYTIWFGVLSFFTCIFLLADVIRNKFNTLSLIYVIAGLGLQTCPFLLTLLLGAIPSARSQLVYPFVFACNAMILLGHVWKRNWVKYFCVLLIAVMFCDLANITARFIYTDEIRAQEDNRLAYNIEQRIKEVAPEQNTVAFIGVYSNHLNNACSRGELIGLSIFNVNSDMNPHYLFSSIRACSLMQTLGFKFVSVNAEQMIEARQKALSMPYWPAKGSVVDTGNYVIVKLSDDRWPEEVMDTFYNKGASLTSDN